jgi:hypothetical protein
VNALATPFGTSALPGPSALGWSPASGTVPIPSLPVAGCHGCPDWSAPVTPWDSSVLNTTRLPAITELPSLTR